MNAHPRGEGNTYLHQIPSMSIWQHAVDHRRCAGARVAPVHLLCHCDGLAAGKLLVAVSYQVPRHQLPRS